MGIEQNDFKSTLCEIMTVLAVCVQGAVAGLADPFGFAGGFR